MYDVGTTVKYMMVISYVFIDGVVGLGEKELGKTTHDALILLL
jgi:hypothetical protein